MLAGMTWIACQGHPELYREAKWELEWFLLTRCPDTSPGGFQEARDKAIPLGKVAHAGGGIRGIPYTNSREALDTSHALGFRTFEVDLNFTRDDSVVLMHDWRDDAWMLDLEPGPADWGSFRRARMVRGLTQMSLADLDLWVRAHPEAWIIADAKDRDPEILRRIWNHHPFLASRLLPQIRRLRDYRETWSMGYRRIILTLYAERYSDRIVGRFAAGCPLLAVTMPVERARNGLPERLALIDVPALAHTVNDPSVAKDLEGRGVLGIYTDWLAPR